MFIIDRGMLNHDVSLSLSTNSKTLKYIYFTSENGERNAFWDGIRKVLNFQMKILNRQKRLK
jgi:hypothetical protein